MDMVAADYQLLLDTFLPAIEQVVQAGGGHTLFATVGSDGSVREIKVSLRDGDSGLVRGPQVDEALFARELREGSYRAAAIFTPITVSLNDVVTRALVVLLDHENGEAVSVRIPFEASGPRIVFGEQSRSPVSGRLFDD